MLNYYKIFILNKKLMLVRIILYNYGLHEKSISIIIKLRKGYSEGPRENNAF